MTRPRLNWAEDMATAASRSSSRNEVGHHRLVGGKADRTRRAPAEGEEDEGDGRIVVRRSQSGQHGGEGHLGQGRDDEPSASVESVGQRTAHGSEQPDGDEGSRGDESRSNRPGRSVA